MNSTNGRSQLIDLPILKAWNRLFELLHAVERNPYDRDGLRNAVLDLFPEKSEKSVFRGMAIPTLRRLGLIIGFNDLIRLGGNGQLIVEADGINRQEGTRTLAAVVFEMDRDGPGFVARIDERKRWAQSEFLDAIRPSILAPNSASQNERINDWLGLLQLAGLIHAHQGVVYVENVAIKNARAALDIKSKKVTFRKLLVATYRSLVSRSHGLLSQPIEDLRTEVILAFYRTKSQILTEMQFDLLLSQFPKTKPNYLVSFGRPMSADEKLFLFQGKYYQTITIQFFEK